MLLAVLVLCLWPRSTSATWKPEYANASPEVQQWYRDAQLTPEAQQRIGFKNCCDHSDVVRTKFKVNHSDGGDEWYWLDGDKWRRVPPDVIHWGETAPNKMPTLFVYSGKETCFYPGEDGI